MNIAKTLENKKLTISIDGRLDTSTAPELDEELKASLGGIETLIMDFTGMVEDVDTLVTTAQSSLEQTMGKLNSIDFDTLNNAIEDLAKVVEPMSKLMNVFK